MGIRSARVTAGLASGLVVVGAALLHGCGGPASIRVFAVPADYKIQTMEPALTPEGLSLDPQAAQDYVREQQSTLIAVQVPWYAEAQLSCFDEQGRKLPLVGSLVDVKPDSRSALAIRDVQIMCAKGSAPYLFSAPEGAKAVTVDLPESPGTSGGTTQSSGDPRTAGSGSFGPYDLAQAGSDLPAMRLEDLRYKTVMRVQDAAHGW
jgi:hypothetical protein